MAGELKNTEKVDDNEKGDVNPTGDQDTSMAASNSQAEDNKLESNNREVERGVAREINMVCNKLDISEVYFSIEEPYELQPLSKYYLHEWSEAEHLFKPAMDFAEEVYSDWSPCPSPTHTSIGI